MPRVWHFSAFIGIVIINLWNEDKCEKDGSQQNDAAIEHSCTDINVAPQYEGDHYNHNQYNAGYVNEGSDRLGVIQDIDLDFACLEGKNNSHKLQESEVDEDEEIKNEWNRARLVALPHTVLLNNV